MNDIVVSAKMNTSIANEITFVLPVVQYDWSTVPEAVSKDLSEIRKAAAGSPTILAVSCLN